MGLLRRLLAGVMGWRDSASPPAIADGSQIERFEGALAHIYQLIDSGRYDDALAAALELASRPQQIAPDTRGALIQALIPLAEGFLQAGHAEHGRRLLANLLSSNPYNAALHERLALVELAVAHGAGAHIAKARDAAERAIIFDAARPWPRVVLAECQLRERHFDEAEAAYQALTECGNDWLMCHTIRFGRRLFDELETIEENFPAPHEFVAASAGAEDCDHVVLVSCDSKYFSQYAGPFVNAFARNGGTRGLLHLHVVDPEPDFPERVASLIAKTGIARIRVTAEAMPFANLSPMKQKAWYTCARFMHFGTWLAEYAKPMVCFDVDTIVERPLDGLIDSCGEADLGLVWRQPRRAIWLDTVGYAVVARPTENALAYFRLLRRFLLHFARQRHLYWQIDQIALRCALIMQERFAKAPRTVDICDRIDDVAWLLARRREGGKTGDPVYLGYQIDF